MAAAGLMTLGSYAQIKTPAPSPSAKIEQTVGLTDVSVTYSRPSMKGRTIMGNLVPYDKVWRTGANANTIVEFSTPVTVGGKELKAGSYALYSKPGKSSWEIYFYSDTSNWGTPREWDDSKVAASITVSPIQMPVNIESFTITVDDLTNDGASIGILWEKTYVGVPFGVPANETVMASIDKVISGPDAGDYYTAATYLLSTDQSLDKAAEYMDKAMGMIENPRFWQLRQQSLILAKTGDKKGAIKAAKSSLAKAKEAGNADYVKLNTDSLKEWGAL